MPPLPLPRDISHEARQRLYAERLAGLQAKLTAVQNVTVDELAELLSELGGEIAGRVRRDYEIERASRNLAGMLSGLQQQIGVEAEQVWSRFAPQFRQQLEQAGNLGREAVDEMLVSLGEQALSPAAARAHQAEILSLQDFSADLIQVVQEDVISAVNQQLRLGVVGGLSPSELILNLEAILPVEGTRFARMQRGALRRAELIVKQELGRVYSLAQEVRGAQFAAQGVEVEKTWHHSGKVKGRAGHKLMDGQRRPMGEKFLNPLTGAELLYPRDPAASAKEAINCECWMGIESPRYRELFPVAA